VVVGFKEPEGSRLGIGALLLATPLDGNLVYMGRVGLVFGAQLLTLHLRSARRL